MQSMTIDDTDVEDYGDRDDDDDDYDHTYVTIPESTPYSSRLAKNAARPKPELPCRETRCLDIAFAICVRFVLHRFFSRSCQKQPGSLLKRPSADCREKVRVCPISFRCICCDESLRSRRVNLLQGQRSLDFALLDFTSATHHHLTSDLRLAIIFFFWYHICGIAPIQ